MPIVRNARGGKIRKSYKCRGCDFRVTVSCDVNTFRTVFTHPDDCVTPAKCEARFIDRAGLEYCEPDGSYLKTSDEVM